MFNAFASNPLVPPPAHKTKTLVCSLIEFDDSLADTSSSEGAGSVVVASFAPAVAKIASAFHQSLLILFFNSLFTSLLPRSSSRICSSYTFKMDNKS